MEASPSGTPGLKRSLSVWAAVGVSVALMAPSMAANINPQGSASYAGVLVLGYTLWRNVIPYPTGTARWFPVVSGAWLVAAVIAVIFAPGTARKLGVALAAREGIAAPGAPDAAGRPGLAAVRDEAS